MLKGLNFVLAIILLEKFCKEKKNGQVNNYVQRKMYTTFWLEISKATPKSRLLNNVHQLYTIEYTKNHKNNFINLGPFLHKKHLKYIFNTRISL